MLDNRKQMVSDVRFNLGSSQFLYHCVLDWTLKPHIVIKFPLIFRPYLE